jgi:hypothetical protein
MSAKIRKLPTARNPRDGHPAWPLRTPGQPLPRAGREQRGPRRRGRRTAGWALLLVLGAAALGAAALWLEPGRLVELESVRVEGAAGVAEDELLRLADLRPGQSLLTMDRGAIERRLLADARIAGAEVALHWPRRVVLRVRERQPIALLRGRGLVDALGNVWQEDRRAAHLDLPLIAGLDEALSPEATRRRLSVAVTLLAEAARMLPERPLSELVFTEDGPVLFFERGPGPVLVGYQRYGAKLELLGRWLLEHPEAPSRPMDLRWYGRILVQEGPGGAAQAREGSGLARAHGAVRVQGRGRA